MQANAASRRYAKALFSIAKEGGSVAELRGELDNLASALDQSDELRSVLLTPLRPAAERKAVVSGLASGLGLSTTLQHFLSYLIDQRRLVALDAIGAEYARLADEDSGLLTADVVSASPLDDARQDQLRRALSARTGRDVKLEVRVDPSLIGGALARVGDLVFDGSIKTQLDRLRNNLVREA